MLVPVDDEFGELSEFSNTIHFAGDGQERCVCYFYNFSKYQKLSKGGFCGDKKCLRILINLKILTR